MKATRGFTLIELLVVIAIIGLLSSVVLAALSSAKGKGNDAKLEQLLHSVENGAELYRTTNGSFGGPPVTAGSCVVTGIAQAAPMFRDSTSNLQNLIVAVNAASGNNDYCDTSQSGAQVGTAWVVAAELPSTISLPTNGYFCVDSTGYASANMSDGSGPYQNLTTGTAHAIAGGGGNTPHCN